MNAYDDHLGKLLRNEKLCAVVEKAFVASASVRRMAAGVIRGVVCWRENQRRVGGDTTWKELMDELNAASRKPGIVVGVPDLAELIPNKVPD
ncbi:MAG: hypothetical protein WD738_11150 [Pirellulales bacterium]